MWYTKSGVRDAPPIRKGGNVMRKSIWLALLTLLLAVFPALAEEDEVSLSDLPPRPAVYLISPAPESSYESGGKLTVRVEGVNVAYYVVELEVEGHLYRQEQEGDAFEHVFTFNQPPCEEAVLRVQGFASTNPTAATPVAAITRRVLSPKEELIERMIALAYANSKDKRYKFAPAEEDGDIGVCKNFVMRLFDTYAKEYRMRAYPDLALHMPKNNSKAACAPYDYGIEWRPETAEDGSPFEIAAQFKYDDSLTEEENAQLARQLLVQIQKGDFFQIVGYYGGGNGPHSMYIIRDYDPVSQQIHWTDSNMRGTRINGVRWGYMQFDADASVDWWVKVFNRRKRGATLYRLRDDLYKQ